MTVIRVEDERAAVELAGRLNGRDRVRPTVVVTTPAGRDASYIDAEQIADQVSGLADVYLMPTGPQSWAFSNHMAALTQVYGGAGRVYPLSQDWVVHPRGSPLRFAYDAVEGERTTQKLIADALQMAVAAGLFSPPSDQPQVLTGGVVTSIPNAERAIVRLDGGGSATVAGELLEPGVPLDRVLMVGQRVEGRYDATTYRLDLRDQRTAAAEALAAYRAGDVVPAEVAEVQVAAARLRLHPAVSVPISRDEVTANDRDDLRTLLTVGEVVLARVVQLGPEWRLAMLDVDDDDVPVPAVALLAGGPPWLEPPPDLPPDVWSDDEATELAYSRPVATPSADTAEPARDRADAAVGDRPSGPAVDPRPDPVATPGPEPAAPEVRPVPKPGPRPGAERPARTRSGLPEPPRPDADRAARTEPGLPDPPRPGAERLARPEPGFPSPPRPEAEPPARPEPGQVESPATSDATAPVVVPRPPTPAELARRLGRSAPAASPVPAPPTTAEPAVPAPPTTAEAAEPSGTGSTAAGQSAGPRPGPVSGPGPGAVDGAASAAARELATLRADVTALERLLSAAREEIRNARDEIRAGREERAELIRQRADQGRSIEGLKVQLAQLKKARLQDRQRWRRPTGPDGGGAEFADPEQGFRFAVVHAWATRTPMGEQGERPLPDYDLGPQFLDSVNAVTGISPDKVAGVVFEVLTGRARDLPGRDLHQLRESSGGGSPYVRRESDGAVCWRAALQINTPQARRLHYWVQPGGRVELSRVVLHDDEQP